MGSSTSPVGPGIRLTVLGCTALVRRSMARRPRDERLLIPGVGFSVEPGVYLKGETGVRSEVNAYVTATDVVVTPRKYQKYLTII